VALRPVSASQGLPANAAPHDAGRRALRAAFVGFFVDMFDMYLPIVVLGPAMSYFQPATLSPALKSTLADPVFPGSPVCLRDLPLLRKKGSGIERVGQSRKD
jgi:hypothetical protein